MHKYKIQDKSTDMNTEKGRFSSFSPVWKVEAVTKQLPGQKQKQPQKCCIIIRGQKRVRRIFNLYFV